MMPTFQDLKEGEYFVLGEQLYRKTGPGTCSRVNMQLIGKHGCRIAVGDPEKVEDVHAEIQLFQTAVAAS